MKTRPSSSGFTLIELLVVVAIIGILAAVSLVALTLARLKGADASIKANLHTIAAQMEVYYSSNNNSYGSTVSQSSPQSQPPNLTGVGSAYTSDAAINGALRSAIAQGGSAYWSTGTGGATYAVAVKLKADSTYWWCVDSTGKPAKVLDYTQSPGVMGSGNSLDRGSGVVGCPSQ